MCGVVNVTHVERRADDQVGSARKIQPARVRRACMCPCVYSRASVDCRWVLELTGNGGTGWLVACTYRNSYRARKKQNCLVVCAAGNVASNVVVSRPALLNNEGWLNRAPCRNLGFVFSPEVKLGRGVWRAREFYLLSPLFGAIVHVPMAGHFVVLAERESLGRWWCT